MQVPVERRQHCPNSGTPHLSCHSFLSILRGSTPLPLELEFKSKWRTEGHVLLPNTRGHLCRDEPTLTLLIGLCEARVTELDLQIALK